jgi:hypothetical protein
MKRKPRLVYPDPDRPGCFLMQCGYCLQVKPDTYFSGFRYDMYGKQRRCKACASKKKQTET